MIRINLLPVRQEQRRQFGKQQLFLGVLLLGVEMAVLFTWHRGLVEERNEVQGRVDAIQAEVNALDSQSQELTRLNEQKQQLEDLQNILEDLEANRAGPVQVLDELKVMLNPPANDLQRVAQDRMGWDTQWDPTNIWLTEFAEDEQQLEVSGKAMSNDDVAEFCPPGQLSLLRQRPPQRDDVVDGGRPRRGVPVRPDRERQLRPRGRRRGVGDERSPRLF